MTDDRALYRWITALDEIGICLVKGAAVRGGQVEKLASRVSHLSYTYYGQARHKFILYITTELVRHRLEKDTYMSIE